MENLIEKWENIGFLENVEKDNKIFFSQNLEKASEYIIKVDLSEIAEDVGKFEQIVFPMIYLLSKRKLDFNIEKAILGLSIDFNENNQNLNNDGDTIKYLEKFVNEYEI